MPADLLPTITLFVTPLLIAAAGELVAERAGVVNIGIEGMMLLGALAAFAGNAIVHPALGPPAAVGVGVLAGLLFALVAVTFAADQIVTGTGINLLALGLTGLLFHAIEKLPTPPAARALPPLAMAAFAPVLLGAVWAYLRFTRPGLELRAVGESPAAAATAGVNVAARKYAAMTFAGACAGLAGSYYSTMRTASFQENMTAGHGFLALALVIMGRWTVVGLVLAGLFFGLVRQLTEHLLVTGTQSTADLAPLLNMLPYAVSLLALAGLAGRSRPPAGLGKATPAA